MEIGKLRHQVSIQRYTEQQNRSGQHVKVWTTLDSRRAFVEPISTRTTKDSVQITPEITHVVHMRHYNLKPDDRLIFNNRILNIVGVKNVGERNHSLEVSCVESGMINSTYTVEANGAVELGGSSG